MIYGTSVYILGAVSGAITHSLISLSRTRNIPSDVARYNRNQDGTENIEFESFRNELNPPTPIPYPRTSKSSESKISSEQSINQSLMLLSYSVPSTPKRIHEPHTKSTRSKSFQSFFRSQINNDK